MYQYFNFPGLIPGPAEVNGRILNVFREIKV